MVSWKKGDPVPIEYYDFGDDDSEYSDDDYPYMSVPSKCQPKQDTDRNEKVPVKGYLYDDMPKERMRMVCEAGNLQKLKEMLSTTYTVDINEGFPNRGQNPLTTACLSGKAELIKYLLEEKHADPNWTAQPPLSTVTALVAIASSSLAGVQLVECASLLVEAGADVNFPANGFTPIVMASHHGKPSLVKYLLTKGADISKTSVTSRPAIYYAAKRGHGNICKILLEHGANIDFKDWSGLNLAEIAHMEKFPHLGQLLYTALLQHRDTGAIDPKTLEEMDMKFEAIVKEDSGSIDLGKMEQILYSAKGGNFLRNFQEHKITFTKFLSMDDKQLKDIGVNLVGVRLRLLEIIKTIHCADWKRTSIRHIPKNSKVTSAELHCMFLNFSEQLKIILSTMKYLKSQDFKIPATARCKVHNMTSQERETELLGILNDCCLKIDHKILKLNENLKVWEDLLGELQHHPKLRISGMIKSKSGRTWRSFLEEKVRSQNKNRSGYLFWGISATGVALGIYVMMKYYKK